ADGVAVEAKGQQRRGLVAGQPEILPVLRRQEGKLAVGGRRVQPAARLVGALVALMLVEPVVRRREANGAFAHGQQMRPLLLQTADAVPPAVQEEDTAPGIEAVGDERGIVAEEIAPTETRPLQQV